MARTPWLDDNQANGLTELTKILAWERTEKGIDDALLKGERLNEMTILEWFSALDEKCRDEVRKVWAE